jgi:rod shape-determining protein MreD
MLVAGFFFLGLFLIGLQTTLLMINPLWIAAPDLYFILVAYLAYRHDIIRSLIILFPLSMVFDVLSGLVLGVYPALFILGFCMLKYLSLRLPVRESLYQVPMIAVCFLFIHWVIYMVMVVSIPGLPVPWSWPVMLLRSGLVIVCGYPLLRFFDAFENYLNKKITGFSTTVRVRTGNRHRG